MKSFVKSNVNVSYPYDFLEFIDTEFHAGTYVWKCFFVLYIQYYLDKILVHVAVYPVVKYYTYKSIIWSVILENWNLTHLINITTYMFLFISWNVLNVFEISHVAKTSIFVITWGYGEKCFDRYRDVFCFTFLFIFFFRLLVRGGEIISRLYF